jgi:intein-encoded DNA endonuclease-like protein
MNNQKLTAEEKQKVIDLRKGGMSYNKIVQAINGKVTPQRVATICKMHELETLKNLQSK